MILPKSNSFSDDFIVNYPKSKKKVYLNIKNFNINESTIKQTKTFSTYISPYGIQFKVKENYENDTLLKIYINIPKYWSLKQQFVQYNRVDFPENFYILGKVIQCREIGKRNKLRLITVKIIIMDDIDAKALKFYLHE